MIRTSFQKLASASFFFVLLLALPGCKAALGLFGVAGFGEGRKAMQNARRAHARLEVMNLVNGIQAFYDDYNHLPEIPGAGEGDTSTTSGKSVINILTGRDKEQNPKNVRYLEARAADAGKGGLVELDNGASAKLLDPWGNPYFVRMDTDYDEELLMPPADKKKLFGRIVIAWSAGPDGRTNPDPEHPDNTDNIYSWK